MLDVIAIIVLIMLLAFDLIILPTLLQAILSWFGFAFSFVQCLIMVVFVYLIIGFLKEKG